MVPNVGNGLDVEIGARYLYFLEKHASIVSPMELDYPVQFSFPGYLTQGPSDDCRLL